jgi:D-aminopeptidase
VRFECFAEAGTSAGQANPAEAIAARAKVVFDKLGRAQPLDVDGYQTISVLRTRYQVAEEARRAPDVNRVHRVTLDYSVRLSHDLPR